MTPYKKGYYSSKNEHHAEPNTDTNSGHNTNVMLAFGVAAGSASTSKRPGAMGSTADTLWCDSGKVKTCNRWQCRAGVDRPVWVYRRGTGKRRKCRWGLGICRHSRPLAFQSIVAGQRFWRTDARSGV